jgi:hypothetical protein
MEIPRIPVVVGTISLAILLIFFLYLIVGLARVETDGSNVDGKAVSACIEKLTPVVNVANMNVTALYSLNGFCYNSLGSQLKIDQERIRRDNFLFQRNENVILLYMVVLITLSGVMLAGIQLLASYKLAVIGRGELSGGGTIDYSTQGVSFKSSVVGLTILAMSFGFFLVFVVDVYTLKDISSDASSQTNVQIPAPGRLPSNLIPVIAGAQWNKTSQPATLPAAITQPGPETGGALKPAGTAHSGGN